MPFLLETEASTPASRLDPHDFLRDLRAFIGRRRGDAILLGEVNLEPEDLRRFFGDEDGDELHMSLNFTSTRRWRCRWSARTPDPWCTA